MLLPIDGDKDSTFGGKEEDGILGKLTLLVRNRFLVFCKSCEDVFCFFLSL